MHRKLLAVAIAASLAGAAFAGPRYGGAANNGGPHQTDEPEQTVGLGSWATDAIITVGDEGSQTDPNGSVGTDVNLEKFGYRFPGIPDGMGAFPLNKKTVRMVVNHEFRSAQGYPYRLANGAELTGARVSYFDVDRNNRKVTGMGLAYDAIYNRAGDEVGSPSDLIGGGLNRLCSANLFEAGEFGLEDTIFFTGEETGGGTEWALDVAAHDLWAAPMMGLAAWESVTLLENFDSNKVVALIGDDRGGAPLLLYVGEKGAEPASGPYKPSDFLIRNGLGLGNLYVWVADNGDLSPADFNQTGDSRDGRFVKIMHFAPSNANAPGWDELGFADQDTQDALADAVGKFAFSRPEDVATNPDNGTQAVMASTGRSSLFPDDKWGTTYLVDVDLESEKLSLDLDDAGLDEIAANVKILYAGDDCGSGNGSVGGVGDCAGGQFSDPDFGLRSPDNLDWADDGFIYLQEDRSYGEFGDTSGEEASIWRMDPQEGLLTRIAQMDRSALPTGQEDIDPTDLGDWESSGILDVTELFGSKGDEIVLIGNTQAHSLREGLIGNSDLPGDNPESDDSNLVQGGQIWFLTR
jgi:hypothetical protein